MTRIDEIDFLHVSYLFLEISEGLLPPPLLTYSWKFRRGCSPLTPYLFLELPVGAPPPLTPYLFLELQVGAPPPLTPYLFLELPVGAPPPLPPPRPRQ